MNNIKVRLSIVVLGAALLSEQECSKNPKESYDITKVVVEKPAKKKYQQPHKQVLTVRTRKQSTAKQSLALTKEAYDYMVSEDSIPESPSVYRKYNKNGLWKKMSKKQRLEAHLNLICAQLGGLSYEYEVFED